MKRRKPTIGRRWNYEAAGGSGDAAGAAAYRRHCRRTSHSTLTLEHPRCVYQLLKQQYSRYTPEMVERITGIPKDQFLKAAELFTSIRKDGDTKKVATVIYAVGWTQHTFRHADHPHRGDAAVAAGQRRAAPAAA